MAVSIDTSVESLGSCNSRDQRPAVRDGGLLRSAQPDAADVGKEHSQFIQAGSAAIASQPGLSLTDLAGCKLLAARLERTANSAWRRGGLIPGSSSLGQSRVELATRSGADHSGRIQPFRPAVLLASTSSSRRFIPHQGFASGSESQIGNRAGLRHPQSWTDGKDHQFKLPTKFLGKSPTTASASPRSTTVLGPTKLRLVVAADLTDDGLDVSTQQS